MLAFVGALAACDGGGGDIDADLVPDDARLPSFAAVNVEPRILFLRSGGSAAAHLRLTRSNPSAPTAVTVSALDLPIGVTADPVVIPADASDGSMVFVARADAVQGMALLRVDAGDAQGFLELLVGGAPGTLDTSYSFGRGVVVEDVGAGRGVTFSGPIDAQVTGVRADGKAFIAYLDEDGNLHSPSPDRVFAFGADTGTSHLGLALDHDSLNRFVVAGASGSAGATDYALFGALFSAQLDPSFGSTAAGYTIVDPGPGRAQAEMVLTDAGGITVVGNLVDAAGSTAHVLRFDGSGIPLADARAEAGVHAGAAEATPGGLLHVAGSRAGDVWIGRYAAGARDPGFGAGGEVVVDLGGEDHAFGLVRLVGGKLLVLATRADGQGGSVLALARLLVDGTPDAGFGDAGVRVTDVPFQALAANMAAVDDLGRVVVAGRRPDAPFVVVRMLAQGTLDETFGSAGVATIEVPGNHGAEAGPHGIGVDPRGRLVVSGQGGADDAPAMVVARVWL